MATYTDLRCDVCGASYTGHSTRRRYCGAPCKQRAFRARRSAAARLRAFHDAARGLNEADLRHLIGEAQRLLVTHG